MLDRATRDYSGRKIEKLREGVLTVLNWMRGKAEGLRGMFVRARRVHPAWGARTLLLSKGKGRNGTRWQSGAEQQQKHSKRSSKLSLSGEKKKFCERGGALLVIRKGRESVFSGKRELTKKKGREGPSSSERKVRSSLGGDR